MGHDARRVNRAPIPKAGGDELGENLQIRIGIEVSTGKIGMVFSHPVLKLALSRDRARTLALGILKLVDEPIPPSTILINPDGGL